MFQVQCARGHWMQIGAESLGERLLCPTCHTYVILAALSDGQVSEPRYEFQCKHGHQLRVKAKYLGREIRCPECQVLVPIRGKTALGLPPDVLLAQPLADAPAAVPADTFVTAHALPPLIVDPAPPDPAPNQPVTPRPSLDDIPIAPVDHPAPRPATRRGRHGVEEEIEEVDPEESKLDRHSMKRAFGIVNTGLAIIKWSLIVAVAAWLLAVFISLFTSFLGLMNILPDGLGVVLMRLNLFLLIICGGCVIPGVAGVGMLLLTPLRTGATWWAMGSLAFFIAVPFIIYWFFTQDWKPLNIVMGPQGQPALDPGSRVRIAFWYLVVLVVVSTPWVMFMLYLRQLAVFLRKSTLRSDSVFLLYLGLSLIGFLAMVTFLALLFQGIPQGIMIAMSVILTLAVTVCLVLLTFKHVILIDSFRYAISRKW